MTIEGFIFTWRNHEARAAALEQKLAAFMPVTVINSESSARDAHPHWVHLDESAYFTAQWNRALSLLRSDLLFHMQADADSDELGLIITRMMSMFVEHRLGVYEPNVDYTSLQFDRTRLRPIAAQVFEVPCTDCTCWCVSRDVLRDVPAIDSARNQYGWGICRVVAAVANLRGRRCVRDYAFTVRHPRARGYSTEAAAQQLEEYVKGLPAVLQAELARMERAAARVIVPPARHPAGNAR